MADPVRTVTKRPTAEKLERLAGAIKAGPKPNPAAKSKKTAKRSRARKPSKSVRGDNGSESLKLVRVEKKVGSEVDLVYEWEHISSSKRGQE